jgi:hypothetical protein
MLLNSLAIVMIKLFFNHYLLDTCKEHLGVKSWLAGIFISIASVSLFFVSMLFPVGNIFYLPGIKNNYLGVFTSNPFHNATYMAARPFAVPSFFLFAKLLDIYEEGYKREYLKDYLLFAFFLLASTMAKPSFTIVLVAAAGLIMLYRLIKSRFKNIIATIQLGLCFIPTFIDLLYQFKGVFVPDEGVEGGIGFCLGEVWKYYCDNIPLAICLAVGFPLVVLVFNYKEITKNTMYRFSWQMYIAGFVMAFFCYEKGFRMADFNFSWSYMYGIFFCFVASLLVLCRKTALSCEKRIFVLIQWLAYAAHLVCGLYYFMTIFRGGMYY